MADVLYPKFKEALLKADVDLENDDIRVALMKSTYTYDAAHDFMDDVTAHENGRSAALTGKTFTNGLFDADNTAIVAAAADPVNAIIVFIHTGDNATARILAYIDRPAFTPAVSQNVPVQWNASGVFSL
jgi:hypothetical protein